MATFDITPQRQLRDTFVQPEQTDRAKPADVELTPQQRGGELLDYQGYVRDQRLEQQVQSIQNFVSAGKGTGKALVKQEAERQIANAESLFDQIAQTELESLELGQLARELRKKGDHHLANQVVTTNSWFPFTWQTKKAEKAAQDSSFWISDWVDANMGILQQEEDPSVVSRAITEKLQTHYRKNYPDIPNKLYKGLVTPTFSKVVPQLVNDVRDEHKVWKVNFLTQSGLEDYHKAVSLWTRTRMENPNDAKVLTENDKTLIEALTKTDTLLNAKGLPFEDINEKVRVPFFKNVPINIIEPELGVNDIADKGYAAAFINALGQMDLPGQKGKKVLDQIDTESGGTYRSLLWSAHANAVDLEGKRESAAYQRTTLENNVFKDIYELNQSLRTQNLTGIENKDAREALLKEAYEAQNNNKPITLMVPNDETGELEATEVNIPTYFDLHKLNTVAEKGGLPVEWEVFEADKTLLKLEAANNPLQDFSELFSKYDPGSTEWKALQKIKQTAISNWLDQDYKTEVSTIVTSSKALLKQLNDKALSTALQGNNNKRFQTTTKEKYENIFKNIQTPELTRLVNSYVSTKISEADPLVLADPAKRAAFFRDLSTDIRDHINNDSYFTNPGQFNTEPQSEQTLFLYNRNENKNVIGEVSRVLDNEAFMQLNAPLIRNGYLQDYYSNEPMINSSTATKILTGITNPSKSFDSESLADLKNGYQLALRLRPGTTVKEFLTGQYGPNVYMFNGYKDLGKYDDRLNELTNRLQDSTNNRKTKIKIHEPQTNSNTRSGLNFHIEDKMGGPKKVLEFYAPVPLQIKSIDFDEGGMGHTSTAIALQNYRGIKAGDIIRISHAKGFGNLQPGNTIGIGQIWGYQHKESEYNVEVDGGTGFHLFIDIKRNGVSIPASELSKLFKEVLSNSLSL